MNLIPYYASCLPTVAPTAYNDPLDWTLIQNWRVADGDMAAIDAAFGGFTDGRPGVIWSLDGTIITLVSNSQDTIRSFTCSTPFDPDTAVHTFGIGATNATHLFANRDGSKIWHHGVGDEFKELPASNFVIGAGGEQSDLSKADLGFSGSSDMSIYPHDNLEFAYIDGPSVRVKRVDFSIAGDLDTDVQGPFNFSINWTQNSSIGGSKVSKDGTRIYRGAGAQGVEVLEFGTPFDVATLTSLGTFDNEVEVGFRPETVFVNPEDTSEVWVTGNSGGLELARMATNV